MDPHQNTSPEFLSSLTFLYLILYCSPKYAIYFQSTKHLSPPPTTHTTMSPSNITSTTTPMASPNHVVTTLALLATLTHVAAVIMSSISLGFALFASTAPNTTANDTVSLVFASATSCGQLLTDHVGASSRPPPINVKALVRY
nr:hypothetical protein Itr_chr11CG13730 [Ipomoea trifida]